MLGRSAKIPASLCSIVALTEETAKEWIIKSGELAGIHRSRFHGRKNFDDAWTDFLDNRGEAHRQFSITMDRLVIHQKVDRSHLCMFFGQRESARSHAD